MIIAINRIAAWIGRLIRTALAAIGLLYVIVTFTPLLQWWTVRLAGAWEDPKGDVLVVLGAETHDDVIGESSYWRSVYAVRCWQEGWVKQIIITGGTSLIPVSERMKQFLVAAGVPERVIQTETRAATTRENALFSKAMIEAAGGSTVLLTSDYHMFRAERVFRKSGIAVRPRPFPDALKRINHRTGRFSVAEALLIETVKITVYWFRGWL